jgi:hypothetical protein
MPPSNPARSRQLAICAAIGLVLALASCDDSPTSPRPPPPPGQPAPATVVRIELVAPPEIAPGESVQLTANAVKSDGSVENVSSQAQWMPTDSPVVQVSSTGLATGNNRGEAFVSARFSGRSANARIFVLPKGTFRLAGTIKESGFGIANVTVTVIAGVGEGLTTLSGFGGSYVLYGVSGPVHLQLKKDGYRNATQQLDVTAHRTADFDIVADRPRKDYSGTYTLTISAASPCPFAFPDAAKSRVYTANVAQDGGRLTVTLSDADFIVTNGNGNRFFGFVDLTDTITFPIGAAFDFYYYYYSGHFDIVERFSATALMVNGTVTARGTPQLISGTLLGAILISSRASAPFLPYSSRCHSNTHGFEMVRR